MVYFKMETFNIKKYIRNLLMVLNSKCNVKLLFEHKHTLILYKQHFYEQHQAEIGKKSSKR